MMNLLLVVIFSSLIAMVIANCGESVFKLIPSLNNTLVGNGSTGMYTGLSVKRCGERCLETPNCASFSFRYSGLTECHVFKHRVWVGHNQSQSQYDDLVTYWKLEESCPPDYVYLETLNVCYKTYLADSDKRTWADAMAHCQQDGGYLYIANTDDKLNVIRKENDTLSNKFAYIGGTMATNGIWRWLDGSNFLPDLWSDGEPNQRGGEENCLGVGYYDKLDKIIDMPCTFVIGFVCEIPLHGSQ